MESSDVLIIGAGHAGVSAASELRRAGFVGAITLVNGEGATPYHRPPLSKGWLKGDTDGESGWLQPANFFSAHDITLLSGARVVDLDPSLRVARLADGQVIGFKDAVLATGALARQLPTSSTTGLPLLHLRDALDAETLKRTITVGSRLAIIGGGFIGLEVAATARHLGAEVCVIEREPRLLSRLASVALSARLADVHRSHGVEILLHSNVTAMATSADGMIDITVDEDRPRTFDAALVAIGAIPDVALARAAGLECSDGVIVDERGQSSSPHIYAIGDVARRPLHPYAESARLESVHNANEQARIVAAHLAGASAPSPATPWFWSDQYDWKLQIAGLLPPGDGETEARGDIDSGSFALLHRSHGRLRCVEAVNSSREFALGKRQIAKEAVAQDASTSAD